MMQSTHCKLKLVQYLSIYLSVYVFREKHKAGKLAGRARGCHTLGDLSNVHAKHSSLGEACTSLALFPLLQRYRHFHSLQQGHFHPNCRLQVPSYSTENRYKKTSLPAPRLAGGWYKYLIATVNLPWHRQKYFTPACCCCDHTTPEPATSGTIRQHLRQKRWANIYLWT